VADIEIFLQEIRRQVPKGDEFSMQDAIIRAARTFCQKSWYVRRQAIFQTTIPGIPKNVVAVVGNAQVTLTWDPVVNAQSYTINAGTVSGKLSPAITMLGQSSGVVLSLNNATPYFFTVQAVNGVGPGLPSQQITATPTSSSINTPATGVPAVAIYSQLLGLPGDEEVIGVKTAQCATFPLSPATPRDMDPKFGPGRPRGFAYAPDGHFMLYPVPNAVYDIMAMIVVQPKRGAVQLPDEIATNYMDGIGYGALKWLYSMKGSPWYDVAAATAMTSMFDDEIQRAKRESLADFQAGNLRVQPAPFIIRSIV